MPQYRTPGTHWIEDNQKKPGANPEHYSGNNPKKSRWTLVYIDASGRRRKESYKRQIDAKQRADELKQQIQNSSYIDPKDARLTFKHFANRWTKITDPNSKTDTINLSLLKSRILPAWGNHQIGFIKPYDLENWQKTLLLEGLSPHTVNKLRVILIKTFKQAIKDGAISKNPLDEVPKPKTGNSKSHTYLTVKQVEALAHAMPTERDRALLYLLAFTGLRIGEALGLQNQAINLEQRKITVQRTYKEIGGRIVEGIPKNRENRVIKIPAFLAEELVVLVENQPLKADIFRSSKGTPISSSNWLQRVFRPAIQRANKNLDPKDQIPTTTRVHDMRHTAASLAIHAGANVKAVQRMLGHKDASMTLNTYAGLFDDDLERVADSLNKLKRESSHSLDTVEKK